MVAGATGIDLFLLVIDAGEGARPQTHEHLAILRLLGVERGVVAVTKADAVDDETLELALEEARELVPGAEVVAVSAKTGAGLDELRAALARAADGVDAATPADCAARLYVDRVFTLRGIGTVVTGTLWSGSIGEGDELRARAGAAATVRVRSVQVHDRPVARAEAGQRVAVSLPGVERDEVRRGDALVAPDAFPSPTGSTSRWPSSSRSPTAPACPSTTGRAASRRGWRASASDARSSGSPTPVVAARGDRVVLRAQTTVGGGRVLDPAPPRHRDPARMERLERGDIAATIHEPVHLERAPARDRWRPSRRRARRAVGVLGRVARGARSGSSGEDRARPTRSTPACRVPSEPWAADVVRAAPVRAPRRQALPPGRRRPLGGSPRGRGTRRSSAGSPRRASPRRRSTTLSSRASSSAKGGSSASGRVRDRRRRVRGRAGTPRDRVSRRGGDHARPVP